jgi:hypothetical protein
MSDLVPSHAGNLFPTRVDRSAGRAIGRVRANQAVVVAQETARLEIIADVTETALLSASHVAAVEALLVARTPHAEGRLRHIAEAGTLGMADVVFRTGQRSR